MKELHFSGLLRTSQRTHQEDNQVRDFRKIRAEEDDRFPGSNRPTEHQQRLRFPKNCRSERQWFLDFRLYLFCPLRFQFVRLRDFFPQW